MKTIFYFLFAALILASCGGNEDTRPAAVPGTADLAEVNGEPSVPEKSRDKTVVGPKVTRDTHEAKPNDAVEDKVISMVLQLPEIRKKDEEIRSKTNGKRSLQAMVSSPPSDDAEYYTVSVGEDNGQSVATHYIFHVYPDNTIMVYDIVNDEEITLKKWRRSL